VRVNHALVFGHCRSEVTPAIQISGPGEPCKWIGVEVRDATRQNREGPTFGVVHVLGEVYIKEIEV